MARKNASKALEVMAKYIPETLQAADLCLRQLPGVSGASARISAALTRAMDMKCRALAEIHMVGALKAESRFGGDTDEVKAQIRAFLDIRWPTQRSGLGMTAPLPAAAAVAPVSLAETAAPAEVINIKAAKARRTKARTATPTPVATVDEDGDFYAYATI